MSNIFKAYDIRGVYPEEINKEIAFKIGGATVKFLQSKNPGKKLDLVVGEDCRLSSPTLRGAVIDAATKAGAKVYYIGFCTTPLFYFSVNKLKADGGIMVTASHNPPQYGGLKIVASDSKPIGADTGLKEIEKMSQEKFEFVAGGTIEEVNLVSDYIDFLIAESGLRPKETKLKVVIDAGNGMTPIVLNSLMDKLGVPYTPIYFKIDCSFPNHSPDISRREALADLVEKVKELGADLGVAFDGDGDRIMFVDGNGEIIRAEYILALLFKKYSGFFNKPKTVYDLRISKSVKELFGSRGIVSRPGHSFIKKVMRENNADLGGELSGHFFFKKMRYAESSVLVMLKIFKIMSENGKPISELIKPFQKYWHSGEINMEIQNKEQGAMIIQKLKEKYKDGKIGELDGVTAEYGSWWFNVRPSNTEPIVRLVVEADTRELMQGKVKELMEEIKKAPQQYRG
ncbi:MAG: phosphomannomutase/phosphoglucomutase [Candidatus Taylorbacteria bacterium]|nr:phosphomannomutase/phosphoglucomutase [Candidatus Taylorbacteria bacterium]